MANPILLTVDDDPDVLRAIERDLRKQYGDRYRVMRADGPQTGLELLRQLKTRSDSVALLLADQRMPQMDGVGFLTEAMELFPDAKRALLTAYADTNAAISAINQAGIHYYFTKPWDPPSEHLYPAIDDLLDDWTAAYHPAYDGIRILGTRWSAKCYEIRDFLARNHVPFQWIDVEATAADAETQRLMAALGPDASSLPVALFPDGTRLLECLPNDAARKIGLRTQAQTDFYDLAIIGGGPAGLAAAVYGASEGLKTVMIEREAPGGQAGLSSRIENYLGFPSGLSGSDLARRAVTQATRFGVEILAPQEAIQLRVEGPYRIIKLADGSELSCHTLMVIRGASLSATMSQYLIDQIKQTPKIELWAHASVIEVHGDSHLEEVSVQCSDTNTIERVPASSLFIFIGALPKTEWLAGSVERDDRGFLLTGPDLTRQGKFPIGWTLDREPFLLETNVPGVFAVGDVRHGSVKRVASGVGEGSVAVQFIHQYLSKVA
jgi:thioredoxin reductase (NADPH)